MSFSTVHSATPAEARVDLSAIRHNVRLLAERASGADLMAVVKADAYGHGALPVAKACRDIHPPSLEGSEQKLFEYLSGWLGGPPLYVSKYGHPMLRRRHFKAPIGPAERGGWLLCFETALAETVEDPALRATMLEPVRQLAAHMQNRE